MNLKEWHDETVSRMQRAVARLEERRDEARGFPEQSRLSGKIEGVKLGLSYMREVDADELGEDGLPIHLPMGVNAEGEGPEDDSVADHYRCWCPDPGCPLTAALRLAERAGRRKAAAAVLTEAATTLPHLTDDNTFKKQVVNTLERAATLAMGEDR